MLEGSQPVATRLGHSFRENVLKILVATGNRTPQLKVV